MRVLLPKSRPRICVLQTDGTNCDQETAHAFMLAEGNPKIVHVNQLRSGDDHFDHYQILAIPGGFSYGDDVSAGTILGIELMSFLKDQLTRFVEDNKLIMGICNGFQVLVKTGLLPFNTPENTHVALTSNDSGKFECRWVNLRVAKSPCVFTRNLEQSQITLPVAHAEGKFWAMQSTLEQIEDSNLVVLRYAKRNIPTLDYPSNPNGSLRAIAGICDKTGRIFGLMPHPERFVNIIQHPNWRRIPHEPAGGIFFQSAVEYAAQL